MRCEKRIQHGGGKDRTKPIQKWETNPSHVNIHKAEEVPLEHAQSNHAVGAVHGDFADIC